MRIATSRNITITVSQPATGTAHLPAGSLVYLARYSHLLAALAAAIVNREKPSGAPFAPVLGIETANYWYVILVLLVLFVRG